MSRFIFAGDTVLDKEKSVNGGILTEDIFEQFENPGIDYFCVNLESVAEGIALNETPGIKFTHNSISALRNSGINIVNLANNHTFDCGIEGLNKTIGALNCNSIQFFGASLNSEKVYKPLILDTEDGLKIAMFGAEHRYYGNSIFDEEPGVADIESEKLILEILDIRPKVDYIILNAHCGLEGTTLVLEHWKNKYRFFIDIGVDLIVGHHPHVVQEMEIYKDRYIFYSLGNFIFDLDEKYKTWVDFSWYKGAILVVDFDKDKIKVEAYGGEYDGRKFHTGGVLNLEKSTEDRTFIINEFEQYLSALRDANRAQKPDYKTLHHYLALDEQGLLMRECLERDNRDYLTLPYRNDTFKLYIKPIIIWGTGKNGMAMYGFLKSKGFKVLGFIDGLIENGKKIVISGIDERVYSVLEAKLIKEEYLIVIASNQKNEISKQIKKADLGDDFFYYKDVYDLIMHDEIDCFNNFDFDFLPAKISDLEDECRILKSKSEDSPVILYLHGAGSNGNDNIRQVSGMGNILKAFKKLHEEKDFELIVPQCPFSQMWMDGFNYECGEFSLKNVYNTEISDRIAEFLIEQYPGRRKMIMGYSCGGFAAWYLILKHHDLFGKALVVSAGPDLEADINDISTEITLVHGGNDDVVSPLGDKKADLPGCENLKYIEFENLSHQLPYEVTKDEWVEIFNKVLL